MQPLTLSFKLGTYENYVRYYDLIGKELYFHLHLMKKAEIRKGGYKKLLPRKYLHPRPALPIRDSIKTPNNLLDFSNRPVKLGINVFVIMKKSENSYCTFIQKRGEKQIEYPGFYHVAPAGTFQPLTSFDKPEILEQFRFEYTVLREFLEEVYNMEDADRKTSKEPFDIFKLAKEKKGKEALVVGRYLLNNEELKERKLLDENENYKIVPTGFLIDLVTLKPELTMVLEIKNATLWKKSVEFFEGNWEGRVVPFNIETDNNSSNEVYNCLTTLIKDSLNIEKFLPAGAVALAEGVNYYFNKVKKNSQRVSRKNKIGERGQKELKMQNKSGLL